MSVIANLLFDLAKSVANSRGSGLSIRFKENQSVEMEFIPKTETETTVWEDHYRNVAFYLGDSANPVRFDWNLEEIKNEKLVNAVDNAVATKYYSTFMKQESLSRIFNIAGPQQDLIVKLLYAIIGIGVLTIMMVLAVYGGM